MPVNWEKAKQLRAQFENARDEAHLLDALAKEARKIACVAMTKAVELENELQQMVIQ